MTAWKTRTQCRWCGITRGAFEEQRAYERSKPHERGIQTVPCKVNPKGNGWHRWLSTGAHLRESVHDSE